MDEKEIKLVEVVVVFVHVCEYGTPVLAQPYKWKLLLWMAGGCAGKCAQEVEMSRIFFTWFVD